MIKAQRRFALIGVTVALLAAIAGLMLADTAPRTSTRVVLSQTTKTTLPAGPGSWTVQTAPDGGPYGDMLLTGLGLADGTGWAIGQWANSKTAPVQPLVEQWNGSKWSEVPFPSLSTADTYLTGMAGVADNNLWIAGFRQVLATKVTTTLTAHWDGTSWSTVSSPSPSSVANVVEAVFMISATDGYAVGSAFDAGGEDKPLILHWNGTSWSIDTAPAFTYGGERLQSVWASGPTDVWAGGYRWTGTARAIMLLHFDGTGWTQVNPPSPSASSAVIRSLSGGGASDVWAVGDGDNGSHLQGFALRYDGASWSQIPTPVTATDTNLRSVQVLAPDDVWMAGSSTTQFFASGATSDSQYFLHYDGVSITARSTGTTSSISPLGLFAAPGRLWAVGYESQNASILTNSQP